MLGANRPSWGYKRVCQRRSERESAVTTIAYTTMPADLLKVGQGTPSKLYIPTLDGLRAVAFTIVFLSHAGLGDLVPGGFGVTTFFFLSGFLITSLFRHESAVTGSISIKKFYLRRILRIFPPLYISLFAMTLMVVFGFLSGKLSFWPILSQGLFLTNYYVLFGADPGGIIHGSGTLWSLAVEEHFYLIYPFVLLFAVKVVDLRRLAVMLAIACALVLIWRVVLIVGFHASDDRTYLATDTRIDSILFGCLLGAVCNPAMDRVLKLTAPQKAAMYAFGVMLLLFTFVYRDEIFRSTFRYTIQGVALLPLFYLAVVDFRAPWFAILNWRPIRFFGTLTYSMYLIHLSIIYAVRLALPAVGSFGCGAIALVLTMSYAALLYILVEKPAAHARRRLEG